LTSASTPPKELPEVHCIDCGRVLGFAAVVVGYVQMKCPKCKGWTTISNFPDELDSGTGQNYHGGCKAA